MSSPWRLGILVYLGRGETGSNETFTRCLTRKLLTYAIGRKLNSSDRPSIDKITKEMASADKGLRDLIQSVVASERFLQN
jgi:hypothetical protein